MNLVFCLVKIVFRTQNEIVMWLITNTEYLKPIDHPSRYESKNKKEKQKYSSDTVSETSF